MAVGPVSNVTRTVTAAPARPAWMTAGAYTAPVQTFATPLAPRSPRGGAAAPMSANTLYNQANRLVPRVSDFEQATANYNAAQDTEAQRMLVSRNDLSRQAGQLYQAGLAGYGAAGLGRSAGAQGQLGNYVAQQQADQQAAMQTASADRLAGQLQAMNEAQRSMFLTQAEVNRETALLGSDPATKIGNAARMKGSA